MQQLERMVAAEPTDAFCLYGLAMEYAKAGRTIDALREFDRAIAADPAYCYAYFHKARAQEAAGDVPGAVATLRAGIEASQRGGDGHAQAEIEAFLDQLT